MDEGIWEQREKLQGVEEKMSGVEMLGAVHKPLKVSQLLQSKPPKTSF